MLLHLGIKNFKLLRDVELEFPRQDPIVLIGTNSSGKSTLLEVLDLLARCARDGLERAVTAHGGMSALRTFGVDDPIEITSTWGFGIAATKGEPTWWGLQWDIALDAGPNGQVLIRSERLLDVGAGDRRRVLVEATPDGRRVVHDQTEPGAEPSAIENPRSLAFEAFVDKARYEGLGVLKAVLSQIRILGSVASAPPWARASAERASARDSMVVSTQRFVDREGIGLAVALYNLQTDHRDAWNRLEKAFQAEFPFIGRIVFPADPGGARIGFAVEDERFPERRIYASEMSDGMISFLCLLSCILNPAQVAVIGLDEPDAHLHPSAVRRFISLIAQSGSRRVVMLATHSNAILDELPDPAASIRVVESTPQGTVIRKLEPEALRAWRAEYTLSEMRRTGLLDPSNSSYGSRE